METTYDQTRHETRLAIVRDALAQLVGDQLMTRPGLHCRRDRTLCDIPVDPDEVMALDDSFPQLGEFLRRNCHNCARGALFLNTLRLGDTAALQHTNFTKKKVTALDSFPQLTRDDIDPVTDLYFSKAEMFFFEVVFEGWDNDDGGCLEARVAVERGRPPVRGRMRRDRCRTYLIYALQYFLENNGTIPFLTETNEGRSLVIAAERS